MLKKVIFIFFICQLLSSNEILPADLANSPVLSFQQIQEISSNQTVNVQLTIDDQKFDKVVKNYQKRQFISNLSLITIVGLAFYIFYTLNRELQVRMKFG